TQGQITVSGNVTVNGNDVTPTGWPSCTTQNVAGAAISPTTTYTPNGGAVSIQGNPSVLTTSAAGDTNTYFSYGGSNYQSLAATANLTYPTGLVLTGIQPIAVGAVCQVSSVPANWGDPNRASPAGACEKYFPIIHVLGDMKVTTGRGQGVLLVDGDFTAAAFTLAPSTGLGLVSGPVFYGNPYGVTVSPQATTASQLPSNGTTYTVLFTVLNTGNNMDSYDLLTAKRPGTAISVASIAGM